MAQSVIAAEPKMSLELRKRISEQAKRDVVVRCLLAVDMLRNDVHGRDQHSRFHVLVIAMFSSPAHLCNFVFVSAS